MNAVAQFQAQPQVESKDSADALLWSLAMDACPESIALIEGREVLHANQAFAQLFGYPPLKTFAAARWTTLFLTICFPLQPFISLIPHVNSATVPQEKLEICSTLRPPALP